MFFCLTAKQYLHGLSLNKLIIAYLHNTIKFIKIIIYMKSIKKLKNVLTIKK